MKRKGISILIALTLCLTATACSNNTSTNNSTEVNESSKIDIKSLDNETVGEANTIIKLGSDMSVEGEGASINNNNINITKAGTYSISGDMEEGQIVVNASSEDKVYIILNGVNITSKSSAPLYVKSAKKCVLALEKGTENTLTDGESYVLDDEANNEPNASIFSKDDLTIIGEGKLSVNGNYNNRIASKDDLKIQSGEIVVNAKNNGIKGKDCINISSGNLTIKSEGDGLKADNTTDATKGYIYIENGRINITSGEDGIQAETELLIADGDITISSGGGSANSSSKSEELSIKDKMKGEKFDPNASINMTDGVVIVNGPENNGNGALDYDGKCEVSGGTLIAAGSLGMVQTPSDSSKQNTLNISLTSQEANTLVNVKSESGEEIITFAPSKSYQSLVICSPNIKSNEKYLVSVGGSSTGKQVDGLYSDGKYSGGANVGDIEVTSVINNITQEGATQGGGMGGGRGGNKGGRPEGEMNGENLTPPGKEMKNPNDAETSATPKNENNSQL
ncbi:carbohydrate-binding domain-containing protein [Clostridium ihumii]|uniref:carbohydrate-binding domain-containing protein n=1 Tax=Clostridium ihumii TaxID=1470356 RepID=UPI000686A3C1|nr:carbohydrate-binding domain-containing protein [Clostridium ihumii]